MTNKFKIGMVVTSVIILDCLFGFDWKFTIINLVWCIPFVHDIIKNKKP